MADAPKISLTDVATLTFAADVATIANPQGYHRHVIGITNAGGDTVTLQISFDNSTWYDVEETTDTSYVFFHDGAHPYMRVSRTAGGSASGQHQQYNTQASTKVH